MNIPVIAITMGDPGGIGPEVIVKSLSAQACPGAALVMVGFKRVFDYLSEKTGLTVDWKLISELKRNRCDKPGVYFYDLAAAGGASQFETGKVTAVNGKMALDALDFATRAALAGDVDALATAPLNKSSVRFVEPGFCGHTEWLAAAAGVDRVAMTFVSPKLKVTLVTVHMALSDVSRSLSQAVIADKIILTDDFLKNHFDLVHPVIAVCCLNPHGSETGPEENALIRPAVEKAKSRGIRAVGPLSADRLFYDALNGKYDAVISMYHDQGLAPFKLVSFHDGVNVTLGLPFVRTSPDHGTAFDIAFQGSADPRSMKSSLELAYQLVSVKCHPATDAQCGHKSI